MSSGGRQRERRRQRSSVLAAHPAVWLYDRDAHDNGQGRQILEARRRSLNVPASPSPGLPG